MRFAVKWPSRVTRSSSTSPLCRKTGERVFAGNDSPIRLLNPIASQLSVMRTQLIGGLVDILKYNLNRRAERDARV